MPQAQDRKPQVAYKTEIIGGVVVHTPISINQVSLRAVLLSDSARSCWWRPWGATRAAGSTRGCEAAPCEPVGCSWGRDLELWGQDFRAGFGVKGQQCSMRGPGGGRFWLWAAGRLVCIFISGNQLSACQTFPLAV